MINVLEKFFANALSKVEPFTEEKNTNNGLWDTRLQTTRNFIWWFFTGLGISTSTLVYLWYPSSFRQ